MLARLVVPERLEIFYTVSASMGHAVYITSPASRHDIPFAWEIVMETFTTSTTILHRLRCRNLLFVTIIGCPFPLS